jgi:uncharacterized protein YbjT (DUF2867 family)
MSTEMSQSQPILVVGATGSVGREVLAALLARDATVRVLVRDAARVADLPPSVQRHVGDLRDPAQVATALAGVQAAFYVSPHEPDEIALATAFVRACEAAGVRLVFAGVHIDQPNRWLRAVQRTMFGLLMPTYRGKLRIGERIARSAARPVVLAPTNFMQNDEIFRDDIVAGVFPEPLAGINRVDLRDVGAIAADALLRPDFPTGVYSVVGPETLSGRQCAQTWARALGRPVRYAGDDDAAWTAAYRRRLTGRKLTDWLSSFRLLKSAPSPPTPTTSPQPPACSAGHHTPTSATSRTWPPPGAPASNDRKRR